MVQIIDEVTLSSKNETFLGYQRSYFPEVAKCMEEGIRLGHEIPAVDLVRENGFYQIRFWRGKEGEINPNNGGHHRCRTYQGIGPGSFPMKARIWDEHSGEPILSWSLTSGMIERDRPGFEDLVRFRDALSYLPEKSQVKILQPFCKRFDLGMALFLEDAEIIRSSREENS